VAWKRPEHRTGKFPSFFLPLSYPFVEKGFAVARANSFLSLQNLIDAALGTKALHFSNVGLNLEVRTVWFSAQDYYLTDALPFVAVR
jgi:hypothetical protein